MMVDSTHLTMSAWLPLCPETALVEPDAVEQDEPCREGKPVCARRDAPRYPRVLSGANFYAMAVR